MQVTEGEGEPSLELGGSWLAGREGRKSSHVSRSRT